MSYCGIKCVLPYTGRRPRDEIRYEPAPCWLRLWRNGKPTDFTRGCLPGEGAEQDQFYSSFGNGRASDVHD